MMNTSKELTKSLFRPIKDTRPWIIWVDKLGGGKLHLFVVKPKHDFFLKGFWCRRWNHSIGRYRHSTVVHTAGPLNYSSPDELTELTIDLVQIGTEHVPPSKNYIPVFSLGELVEVMDRHWQTRTSNFL